MPRARPRLFNAMLSVREAFSGIVCAGGWPARLWGMTAASRRVDVIVHRVEAFPAGHAPLRIAFLSDIHIGPTTAAHTLDAAFRLAAEARPDVLVLGGDHVFAGAKPWRVAELRERVAAFPAPRKLAVLGNHDYWTDHARVAAALRDAGATVLVNQAVRLDGPHGDVALLGIDDPLTGVPDADAAISACGDAAVRLAICHAPEGLPMLQGRGVRLLLCGHTHGGHIALPSRPLYVPGAVGRRHPHGRFEVGGLTMIVSRGVGAVSVPMRWNAPPDVLVVDVVGRATSSP